MIETVLTEARALKNQFRLARCGIGFGGPVDFERQQIVNSTHITGWDDVPLPGLIEEALDVPAVADNDANLGALGEFVYGAGRGAQHLLYYTVSTGIGGGVILDGRIHRGGNSQAGEVGHVPILPGGPVCACGNRGCLEALCSGPAIARRAEDALLAQSGRSRLRAVLRRDGALSAKHVIDAAKAGDRLAKSVVDDTASFLGMGVASAVNLFAPDRVVIGGGVAKAGRVLLDSLRRETRRFVMPVHRPHVDIVQARRGDRSVLLGAMALVSR